MTGATRVRHALRVAAASIGAVVGLYLFFLLPASLIVDAIERVTGIGLDGPVDQGVALSVATLGAVRFAVEYGRGRGSLERLWTFVIAAHLLTYAVLFPYFHLVDAREGLQSLFVEPVGSVAYFGSGYVLVGTAMVAAYVLVYRDGFGSAKAHLPF